MKNLFNKLKVEKRLKALLEKLSSGRKASIGSAKQLLRKATAMAQGVGKKSGEYGRKGLKQWPYAVLVIILFVAMMPMLQAQIPALSPIVNTLSMAKEEPKYKDQESQAIPYDLFSQQAANEQPVESEEDGLDRENIQVVAPVDPAEQEDAVAVSGNVVTQDAAEEIVEKENEQPEARQEESEQGEPKKEVKKERPLVEMAWPIPGSVLTNYGFGYSEVYGDYRFHKGVHIGGQKGTKVAAAAKGKVLQVGENQLHGQFVKVEHQDGYISFYGNLADVAVKVGDKVEVGSALGKLGEPGYESLKIGPSVYFRISWEQSSVDPLEVLEVKK